MTLEGGVVICAPDSSADQKIALGSTIQRALGKIDRLSATTAFSRLVEFIGKYFVFRFALGTFADERFEMLMVLEAWTMLWRRHGYTSRSRGLKKNRKLSGCAVPCCIEPAGPLVSHTNLDRMQSGFACIILCADLFRRQRSPVYSSCYPEIHIFVCMTDRCPAARRPSSHSRSWRISSCS